MSNNLYSFCMIRRRREQILISKTKEKQLMCVMSMCTWGESFTGVDYLHLQAQSFYLCSPCQIFHKLSSEDILPFNRNGSKWMLMMLSVSCYLKNTSGYSYIIISSTNNRTCGSEWLWHERIQQTDSDKCQVTKAAWLWFHVISHTAW